MADLGAIIVRTPARVPVLPDARRSGRRGRAGGGAGLGPRLLADRRSKEDSPEGYPQTPPYKLWNWHDEYGTTSSSQWSNVVDRSLVLLAQAVEPEPVARAAKEKP